MYVNEGLVLQFIGELYSLVKLFWREIFIKNIKEYLSVKNKIREFLLKKKKIEIKLYFFFGFFIS